MSSTTKNVPNESKGSLKPQSHTYTPRSHEELLKKFSRNAIKGEDVNYLKRENENLKRELNTSNKQLKRLHQRITILENKKKKEVKSISSFLNKLPESQSDIHSEIKLDTDNEYVKSWEVLGHHFSEVIRRHHEVLAEKDRQIRELQEQQHNKEIWNKGEASQTNENTISGIPKNVASYDKSTDFVQVQQHSKFENGETGLQDRSEAGPSRNHQCADQYNCTEMPDYRKDSLVNSGEVLSEHFSEVIRRHKHQLLEKDRHIQELQEALECCQGRKSPTKPPNASEVQMWYHDYYHSQPSFGTQHLEPKSPSSDKQERHRAYSEDWDPDISHMPVPSSSDEEEGSLLGSADTFVAIEKCQRLESIANLERLRQNLIQRLETEEKLDKLYWQTELNRYRELREEAGDSFDLDCLFNKDFEMLEATRLELLRALKHMKDSAEREPEMYVKTHVPGQDSDSILSQEILFPESESKRRVTFTEQVTITKHTTYDS